MFQQLPQEERFSVEGIIVGMMLAREQSHPEERREDKKKPPSWAAGRR